MSVKKTTLQFLRLLFVTTFLLVVAQHTWAHEVRPAFLEIREIEPEIYDILWRTPAQGDMRLALNVNLPENCKNITQQRFVKINAAVEQKWRSQCVSGLAGKIIEIENLKASLTDTILRYVPLNGSVKTLRILGSEPSAQIPEHQSQWNTASTYTRLGTEHILSGIDHLLFVFCLLLLLGFHKQLLWAITAFTAAHSITLALTTLDILYAPVVPTEALIALSIVYLAIEALKGNRRKPSTIKRIPSIATFGFGLLHGFGFASALRDIGLPEDAIPTALLFFNLGVELGQLFFIVVLFGLFKVWKKYAYFPTTNLTKFSAYLIGITASYWFIERTVLVFAG